MRLINIALVRNQLSLKERCWHFCIMIVDLACDRSKPIFSLLHVERFSYRPTTEFAFAIISFGQRALRELYLSSPCLSSTPGTRFRRTRPYPWQVSSRLDFGNIELCRATHAFVHGDDHAEGWTVRLFHPPTIYSG